MIAGEDTESFLDEVDRVQEVADIDAMTDAEEEESFESEWEEPTLDIGYDTPKDEKLDMSRRERVLLDPLKASKKSDDKKKEENKEGSFYGYKPKHDNFYPELDD